jgi:RimJ/RimL family protein N-acetyltransferase
LTITVNDVTMRPITGRAELELFCQMPYVLNEELSDDLESGWRRPEWMWVAVRGDRVLARLAWWGNPEEKLPQVLDVVDADDLETGVDRVDMITALLTAAMAEVIPAGSQPPEYSRFVPPDWRYHPTTASGIADRMAALERTGARPLVERLRFEWHPGTPIARSNKSVTFRQPLDNEEIVELMTIALDGTLDAHSQHDMAQMSPHEAAVHHFDDELASYQSPRAWWRIAMRGDGEPVGFVMPARNHYNAIIAYLAVLPRYRGNGYVNEILAEGTDILARQHVPRIRASTDLANVPMAVAFQRAGWNNFERTINMTW